MVKFSGKEKRMLKLALFMRLSGINGWFVPSFSTQVIEEVL
jgi:hypothetical protein